LSLHSDGLLPRFPFGTRFTEDEQRLMPALDTLKQASSSRRALGKLFLSGMKAGRANDEEARCLARMGFDRPRTLKDRVYKKILHAALRQNG
jgi:hypothetical protein